MARFQLNAGGASRGGWTCGDVVHFLVDIAARGGLMLGEEVPAREHLNRLKRGASELMGSLGVALTVSRTREDGT